MLEITPMLKHQRAILLKKLQILNPITSSQRYAVGTETSLCMMPVVTIMTDQVFFQFSLTLSNFHGRAKTKLLNPNDLKIAHRYVFINCSKVEPYLRSKSQLYSNVPSMPRQQFNAFLEEKFPIIFKEYVSLICFK